MTKEYCDMCGKETEGLGLSISIVHKGKDKKLVNTYYNLCEVCNEALLEEINKRRSYLMGSGDEK